MKHEEIIKIDKSIRDSGLNLYQYKHSEHGFLNFIRHFVESAKLDIEYKIKDDKIKQKDFDGILKDLQITLDGISTSVGLIPTHIFNAYVYCCYNVRQKSKNYKGDKWQLMDIQKADAERQAMHHLILKISNVEKNSEWDKNVLQKYVEIELKEMYKK